MIVTEVESWITLWGISHVFCGRSAMTGRLVALCGEISDSFKEWRAAAPPPNKCAKCMAALGKVQSTSI